MSSMEVKRKPQKKSNPEINSEDKTSSETTLSDSTSSDQKSVTLSSSSNTNSTYPSFSKLLQGVVLAANSVLSSDSSAKSSGFQGQFAMSHQEALADVTAKAAKVHPQMQLQPESTKSVIKPLPKEKVEENERTKGNSFHTDEPPDDAPRTPKSDGYSWRKYGQKQVKSSGSSRSYYRCTNLSCCAKKKVQHMDVSGQVIEVVYKGDHNHDPPQNLKGSNRKKESTSRALKNCSESSVQNLDNQSSLTCERELKQLVPLTHESQDTNQKNGVGTPSTPREEELHTKTVDTTSRQVLY
ncbi:putative WRKY transcription factor 4 [Bienertia sinuspersici]